jgi:hypothetical protein
VSDKRITVEDIRAAVAKNVGVRLIYGSFGTGVDCGCPETQLYLAAGNTLDRDEDEEEQRAICHTAVATWAEQEYGPTYALAFRTSFDFNRAANSRHNPDTDTENSEYLCGLPMEEFQVLSRDEQREVRCRWQTGCHDGVVAREALLP